MTDTYTDLVVEVKRLNKNYFIKRDKKKKIMQQQLLAINNEAAFCSVDFEAKNIE